MGDESLTNQAQIRLGGAWKVAAEKQSSLERNVKVLLGELDGVRKVLATVQNERLEAEENLKKTKEELEHVSNRDEKSREMLGIAERQRKELETAVTQRDVEIGELKKKLELLSSSLRSTDLMFRNEEEKSGNLGKRLQVALFENEQLQLQYDALESRAEKSELQAKHEAERADLLQKAKVQKERNLCILVKERDRAQQEIVNLQSRLSKIKLHRSNSRSASFKDENINPNKGSNSLIARITDEERMKLSPYEAPSRFKEQLIKEAASRKRAELEVARLKAENNALRTRYRNLRDISGLSNNS